MKNIADVRSKESQILTFIQKILNAGINQNSFVYYVQYCAQKTATSI